MTDAQTVHPTNAGGTRFSARPTLRFMLANPAHLLALGFGSGLSRFAPGTAGTLWAWVFFLALSPWMNDLRWALLIGASVPLGWWVCTVTARNMGVLDPASVVWDEVVAFWLILWLVMPTGLLGQLVAFGLFRGLGRPPVPRPGPQHRPLGLGQGWLGHHARRPGGRRLHAPGDCAVAGMVTAGPTAAGAAPAEGDTAQLVQALADQLLARGWMLAAAESCTGGLIAAACTDLAGSSQWFERGFVTYSNAAKAQMLGVDAALIAQHGAVSEAVARAMAQGALPHSQAQVALAVTGVAGPGGGSADKPVGTVWFAWAWAGQVIAEKQTFAGDRATVRQATVQHSLRRLLELLPSHGTGRAAA
jgi:nicotinamide-nucleotide amidase